MRTIRRFKKYELDSYMQSPIPYDLRNDLFSTLYRLGHPAYVNRDRMYYVRAARPARFWAAFNDISWLVDYRFKSVPNGITHTL